MTPRTFAFGVLRNALLTFSSWLSSTARNYPELFLGKENTIPRKTYLDTCDRLRTYDELHSTQAHAQGSSRTHCILIVAHLFNHLNAHRGALNTLLCLQCTAVQLLRVEFTIAMQEDVLSPIQPKTQTQTFLQVEVSFLEISTWHTSRAHSHHP